MEDKNYLVEVVSQHCDRETYQMYIISAPCSDTAGHYALYLISYDPSSLCWDGDLDCAFEGDYQYYHQLHQVEEILPDDLKTLKKHVTSHKHNTTDLNKCGEYEELRFIQVDCGEEATTHPINP